MSHSRQNTARWRSPSAGAVARVAASSVTPERAVSHALVAPGDGQDRGKPRQRGAYANRANGPAEGRRGDHGAGGKQTDEVAVHQAVAARHRQVHRLLDEDVPRAATDAEEHPVPDGELGQAAGGGGERDARGAHGGAEQHEQRARRETIHVGRQVHARAESHRREAEDEREIGAAQPEQGFQRLEKHAERIERTERSIERGRRRDCRPGPPPACRPGHDDRPGRLGLPRRDTAIRYAMSTP